MTLRLRRPAVLLAAVALALSATLAAAGPASAAAPTVGRIGGVDRYDTAARLSKSHFAPGVPVALIASGEDFPDALAAAPAAAALGGPVLLTQQDSLPDVTKTELQRLHPQRILIVGGLGVVSGSVETALGDLTNGTVTRVAGNDRFATAADLATTTFTNGAGTVFVASGLTFPDALSGGAAAGTAAGPMLLVPPDQLPDIVKDAVTAMHTAQVIVVGGTDAVSDDVLNALKPLAPGVQRWAGIDRYDTAVVVSQKSHLQPGVDGAFLATGENFPDALAAGPIGGLTGSPVLLVQPDCIPQEVQDELSRLQPQVIVVLGGTGAVSDDVVSGTTCVGD